MSSMPINRKVKLAGKKYGFAPRSGRQVPYGYIDSPTATRDHYSSKISNWIDMNKDDVIVQKHFPEHDGNGGNAMLYHARKGKIHPLTTHPNFPSDAKGYLQYEKEKAKSSKTSIQMTESQDNLMKKNHILSEESLTMSKELIHHLIHKRYDNADSILKEELMSVVQEKLEEKKKMIAAGLTTEGLFRKAQTDPSTGKPITRTKSLKAAMKLNKGNFVVPAAIAAGGIATGAGIFGTSPKSLATLGAIGAGVAGAAHLSHIAKDYKMFRGKGNRAYRPGFADDVLGNKIFEAGIMKAISKIGQRRRLNKKIDDQMKNHKIDNSSVDKNWKSLGREAQLFQRKMTVNGFPEAPGKRNPKGLAEGKSPKEAVGAALEKYFQGKTFTTDKEALKKSDEERGSDKDFQNWKKKRAEKAND